MAASLRGAFMAPPSQGDGPAHHGMSLRWDAAALSAGGQAISGRPPSGSLLCSAPSPLNQRRPRPIAAGISERGGYSRSSRCRGRAARSVRPVQFMSAPDDDRRMLIFLVVLAALFVLASASFGAIIASSGF